MVKLQDDKPRFPAVEARGLQQQVPDVGHVALLARSQTGIGIKRRLIQAPRARPGGRPDAVAVDANNFAVDKLTLKAAYRGPMTDKSPDALALVCEMIELEDQWICLAAI